MNVSPSAGNPGRGPVRNHTLGRGQVGQGRAHQRALVGVAGALSGAAPRTYTLARVVLVACLSSGSWAKC